MNEAFKKYLLNLTKAKDCDVQEVLQELWSGYGQIVRVQLDGAQPRTLVVKEIELANAAKHPRGWNTHLSHERKLKSYQVETHWYQEWSPLCNKKCRIPAFLGCFEQEGKQWIVLEDLDSHFPVRKSALSPKECKLGVEWLAHFHATFLGEEPKGLWPIGTYWHLQTRPDEWAKMEASPLKAKAHIIDEKLNNCQFNTLVHGDAKVANFCFAKDGSRVAALDFQYVGGGCGMKDLAYFLGSCLSSEECAQHEKRLLNHYFADLEKALVDYESKVDFHELEQEWRSLYPFAIADFTRFLLGWMPEHEKVNQYHLSNTTNVLTKLNRE